MGRLVAFLAKMAAGNPAVTDCPRSIAASRNTAALVYPDRSAEAVGTPGMGFRRAYFVTAPDTIPLLGVGQPLSWTGIEVIRVEAGGTFNLATWSGDGRRYLLDVIGGRLAVEGNNDFY
jgi:hypothetical protein